MGNIIDILKKDTKINTLYNLIEELYFLGRKFANLPDDEWFIDLTHNFVQVKHQKKELDIYYYTSDSYSVELSDWDVFEHFEFEIASKEIELKKQYDADTLEKYSKDFLIDFCKQALEFLNARYEYFLPLKQQKLEELRRKRNKINEFERG